MAYTTIDKPTDYFNTVLWTGDGTSGRTISGVGFQSDFLWIKSRSNATNHSLTDVIRGGNLQLRSNTTDAESQFGSQDITFTSDGFTNAGSTSNNSGFTFVGWNWLAGGTGVSNTDGTITSTVSANTTSGFSIVSYTGNGSTNQSVGHGLSQAPEILITKGRTNSQNWAVYGSVIGVDKRLYLNTTDTADTLSGYLPADTSSVINLSGTSSMSNINTSSIDYITYAFHSVKGYSKIGSYTGNGSTDGTFVYTGFKPAFVLYKQSSSAGNQWEMRDNLRDVTFNPTDKALAPNLSSAEFTTDPIDLLSNGFKFRGGNGQDNGSGSTYIYMCFAENPFTTSTGIPCTAR
jgi:hypothetical protein